MYSSRKNLPVLLVSLILIVGLAAGAAVAQREQAVHEKTTQKRQQTSTLLDTIPAPNDARKIEYQATAVEGQQQFSGQWSSSASLINIANYYYESLPANNWQITSEPITNQNQTAGVITATQQDRTAYISLSRNNTTDLTTISVAIPSKSPAQIIEVSDSEISQPETQEKSTENISTKIAFIANTGVDKSFQEILTLIKNEQADYVVHVGDFDLQANPELFAQTIDESLGETFPYFYVIGDHDLSNWNSTCFTKETCYTTDLLNRLDANQLTPTFPNQDQITDFFDAYSVTAGPVQLVALGLGDLDTSESGIGATQYAPFITETFANSQAPIKVCAFHETMFEAQVGNQIDSMGWQPFEACREQGALIITGSDHKYSRSKTVLSYPEQTLSEIWGKDNLLRLEPGTSFIANVGLGGANFSLQERCKPITAPYGCQNEWASIYSINQSAKPGVLFLEIENEQPTLATAYFKNSSNQLIDSFSISLWQEGATLTEIQPIQDTKVLSVTDKCVLLPVKSIGSTYLSSAVCQ